MILFYSLSLLIIALGVYIQYQHYIKNKKSGYIETIGTVIDYKMNQHSDGEGNMKVSYFPIIEFYVNNQNYRIISNIGDNKKKKIGKQEKIKYNPEKPTDCIIENNLAGLYTIIVGIIFLIITVICSIHN